MLNFSRNFICKSFILSLPDDWVSRSLFSKYLSMLIGVLHGKKLKVVCRYLFGVLPAK